MKCQLQFVETLPDGRHLHRCPVCKRNRRAPTKDSAGVKAMCGKSAAQILVEQVLSAEDRAKLFPESDPTLIGNRLAAMTKAIGIPPCKGCEQRQAWLNNAELWLRGLVGASGS